MTAPAYVLDHKRYGASVLGGILVVLGGCGARSGLDLFAQSASLDGGASVLEDGSSGPDTGSGPDSGSDDLCPSAISGPSAMSRNCSTRDGRSRVLAPRSPHVTWTTKLPLDGPYIGPGALSTDASGHVYVVSTDQFGAEATSAIRRVNASDGTIDWTTPIVPDDNTGKAVLLSAGGVDLFAYGMADQVSLFTFAPASGTSTSTTLGLDLYDLLTGLAVGTDGSLYFIYEDDSEPESPSAYVTRVAPDGTTLWRSADIQTLSPPALYPQDGANPGDVALGVGDLVVVINDVLAESSENSELCVAIALDPATGKTLWTSTPAVTGTLSGGPVIRPDGSVAALLGNGPSSTLVNFDPATGAFTIQVLPSASNGLFAVTREGVILAGMGMATGNGIEGVSAIAEDGTVLWTQPRALDATIASDGTVIARAGTAGGGATSILALDVATGATKWELQPPVSGPTIWYVALTSEGGVVGEQADGTLFGASD